MSAGGWSHLLEPGVVMLFHGPCLVWMPCHEIIGFRGVLGKVVEGAFLLHGDKLEITGAHGPFPGGTPFGSEKPVMMVFHFSCDQGQERAPIEVVGRSELSQCIQCRGKDIQGDNRGVDDRAALETSQARHAGGEESVFQCGFHPESLPPFQFMVDCVDA